MYLKHLELCLSESHITMEPSKSLQLIASLPLDDQVPTYSSGLGDFLMAGVTPAEQEKVIIPSKHKKTTGGQEKYKLSYTCECLLSSYMSLKRDLCQQYER